MQSLTNHTAAIPTPLAQTSIPETPPILAQIIPPPPKNAQVALPPIPLQVVPPPLARIASPELHDRVVALQLGHRNQLTPFRQTTGPLPNPPDRRQFPVSSMRQE